MKFRAHETFSIRKGWLSKGMKHVLRDPYVFVSKEYNPMDVLGIGSNMVKSLRYWMLAVGLSDSAKGKSAQYLTKFGRILYENDPYIEEMGTLWLLHYKLARQQDIMLKQEQLSVLGEMAGGMAHDINTPISAINTAITMLSKKTTDEREQAILKNMQISTDRIISIVTSMRNQVRNMGSDAKENFSLNTMASDLNVIVQNELKKSGCTFTIDIKEEISIYGERTKLGQVLTNLVVNGIQAYSSNGKKGNVTLFAKMENPETCLIEIIDEAGGIPEKVQPYIFNNIMTTKGSKGTGLGLYLAATVIKGVYEGSIDFETEVGKGTKFIIKLPMKREDKK